MKLYADIFRSPVGTLGVAVDEDERLARVSFLGELNAEHFERELARTDHEVVRRAEPCGQARAQLEEYFRGERRSFSLVLAPRGTPFQLRVWEELARIPFGKTASYGEIALRIGQPAAVRAVGQANHVNPLPIVVPCHRVIGADGKLAGFGGGIEVQRALLALEAGSFSPALFPG